LKKLSRDRWAAVLKTVLLVVTIVTLSLVASIYPITIPWKLVFASPDTQAFCSSSYALLGSTQYVSGSLTNLSDEGVYMTFRSYVSVSSTTAKTDAFIAYRDLTTTLNTPKERTWTGETTLWGGQTEMPAADRPVRFSRVAYSPIESRSTEKIVVTLSNDGYLDAYVWNGTSWTVTNNVGNVGRTANTCKCFDVAYEKTSGEALLVYAIASTSTTQDLAYKTWIFGTGWSSENYIDDTGHATDIQYYWVGLASKPTSGSNKITMVGIDFTDADANGWVWDGLWYLAWKCNEETSCCYGYNLHYYHVCVHFWGIGQFLLSAVLFVQRGIHV